ncbi:polysaccharide deacetylase family protein [Sphingomonas sp.]|uniref:polysaccharide deacetylase family protein n=1 Tax=Sphingomonas sp. TaxID=28214 RepID=UPI001DA37B15|nr:polysaccharide deacetylase family protein [Sphingomonas sp.]MBX9797437.1 polysaccharide deacetylase family protein [Sphingomonas sp.]
MPAPAAEALVAWPDALGTRFTVFVDTEEEFDWTGPFTRDRHGTSAIAAIPEAHARFAAMGVPLAYMVDYPVVADPRAVDVLRGAVADGVSTIGAQLHAWVTPPFDEPLDAHHSYAGNLAPALEAAKLDTLTAALTQAFGRPPRAYRAGRYGIGPQTLALLAARGYRLDSSVRARYDYRGDGGPDFTAVGPQAYRCGPGGALIELPLTTAYTGAWRGAGPWLYPALGRLPRGRGLFARAGLLQRVALTPEQMPANDALEAVRVALGEGVRVLNFAFHSPSLAPGHTPYVRDAADLARFWRWWDAMLALLARAGVKPIGLEALIDATG